MSWGNNAWSAASLTNQLEQQTASIPYVVEPPRHARYSPLGPDLVADSGPSYDVMILRCYDIISNI